MTQRLTLGGWPTVTWTFSAVRCDGSTRKTYQVRETPRSGVADPRPRLLISPTPRAQASPGFACDPKSRARESRMRTASRTLPCTASRTAPRILARNRLGAALKYRRNGERTSSYPTPRYLFRAYLPQTIRSGQLYLTLSAYSRQSCSRNYSSLIYNTSLLYRHYQA